MLTKIFQISLIGLTSFFTSLTANAQMPSQIPIENAFRAVPHCSGAVAHSSRYLATQLNSNQAMITDITTSKQILLTSKNFIRDIKLTDKMIYLLGNNTIEIWDIAKQDLIKSVITRNLGRPLKYRENAFAMSWWNLDKLIIAHGRAGYSIFDLVTEEITAENFLLANQLPHESTITDVTIYNNTAIFSVMEFTMSNPGQPTSLNGFVLLDLETQKEHKPVRGLDPGAETIDLINNNVLVGFGNHFHLFKLNDILTKSTVKFTRIFIPREPRGIALGQNQILGNKLLTCFWTQTSQNTNGAPTPLILDASSF